MLVGNIMVVEGEVRWRRSKSVFRNWVFYLFRNSEGAMRVTNLGGVCNLVISVDCSLNYSHHEYNTKLYNHTKEME